MIFTSVEQAIAAYRAALVEMDSISFAAAKGARRWNKLVNELQRAQLYLRETSDGRSAISALVGDPVHTVAQWAASHALMWDESLARGYLESERDSNGRGALNATITLKEFDAGRLRHDWLPSR